MRLTLLLTLCVTTVCAQLRIDSLKVVETIKLETYDNDFVCYPQFEYLGPNERITFWTRVGNTDTVDFIFGTPGEPHFPIDSNNPCWDYLQIWEGFADYSLLDPCGEVVTSHPKDVWFMQDRQSIATTNIPWIGPLNHTHNDDLTSTVYGPNGLTSHFADVQVSDDPGQNVDVLGVPSGNYFVELAIWGHDTVRVPVLYTGVSVTVEAFSPPAATETRLRKDVQTQTIYWDATGCSYNVYRELKYRGPGNQRPPDVVQDQGWWYLPVVFEVQDTFYVETVPALPGLSNTYRYRVTALSPETVPSNSVTLNIN